MLGLRDLPAFSTVKAKEVEPELDKLLEGLKEKTDEVLRSSKLNWNGFVKELQKLDEQLRQMWSPISHLNSVCNTEALREAYNVCLPKLSQYSSELGQHQGLYQAFLKISTSEEFSKLSRAQKKVIDHRLRDFKLSGIALNSDQQLLYREIQKKLSELSSQFSENVLDSTQFWTKFIQNAEELPGLPATSLALLKQNAKVKNQEGYLINLEFPSYLAVMTHCENRDLREEVYRAFVTRASELKPHDAKYNNQSIMDKILELKQKLAKVLGFQNFAELSLETKMVKDSEEVLHFLNFLAEKSIGPAREEYRELESFAKEHLELPTLEAWDIQFTSEKLRQDRYQLSQEECRPYFPLPKVLNGLFKVVEILFKIEVKEVENVETWHDDVRFFEIYLEKSCIAKFYLDPFARENKRGGAWMDECRVRHELFEKLQLPVAYLVCNFTPPIDGKPALLTHDEVTTLFHEFGHGLHHMLTQVDIPDVSGINGVAWDAVELPSQFLENWCWQKESLNLIAEHYESGEKLPDALLDKMLKAKNFQSAMMMVRQLEFAIFDFRIHMECGFENSKSIQKILDEVRVKVAVVHPPEYNRFQHGFTHIFSGGYSAGYYSYKWAEVLAADAFSKFEEEGVLNPKTGNRFLTNILAKGGSEDAEDLFVAFMGRKPNPEALLKQSGIMS